MLEKITSQVSPNFLTLEPSDVANPGPKWLRILAPRERKARPEYEPFRSSKDAPLEQKTQNPT